jgi:hypothetical protein
MYVSSNPIDESSLNLDREITELQRQLYEVSAEPIQFIFLPKLKVEDLPGELNRWQPDVLHLAAHGDQEALSLAQEDGKKVRVTADMLCAFFNPRQPPKLVYLNACDSQDIASKLSGKIGVAIGSTAPITNRTARASAVTFYRGLLSGYSVDEAFTASQKMVEALEDRSASTTLFPRHGVDPKSLFLCYLPRLVAKFKDPSLRSTKSGYYSVLIGVMGCPASTTQVIFFTDDETFITDDDDDLEGDLCHVIRGIPTRGAFWIDNTSSWSIDGDFRLFVVGVTADARTFSLGSTLCNAIEAHYNLLGLEVTEPVSKVLERLRSNDGGPERPYSP